MTTIKITKPESTPGDTPPANPPKQTARPLVPPRAPSSAKFKNKVILSTLDGKIEWEKMTPEARKAFEELFGDEKFLKQFGVVKGEKAFKPEQMKMLYDGISTTYQWLCGMLLRWPPQVLQLLAYDDDEKEMLAEPTADLVNRFAPKLVMENRELVIFLAVFGSVTNAKFMKASHLASELAAKKRPQVVPGGHAPKATTGAPPKTAAPAVVVIPATEPTPAAPDAMFAEWPGDGNGAVV